MGADGKDIDHPHDLSLHGKDYPVTGNADYDTFRAAVDDTTPSSPEKGVKESAPSRRCPDGKNLDLERR